MCILHSAIFAPWGTHHTCQLYLPTVAHPCAGNSYINLRIKLSVAFPSSPYPRHKNKNLSTPYYPNPVAYFDLIWYWIVRVLCTHPLACH